MSPGQHSKAVRAVVRGRVQGVGFRFRAMWAADEQGVTGWVRNEDDGSVQIHAEGPDHRVEQFLSIIKAGFPGASVSRVEVSRSTPEGFTKFRVTY